MVDGSDLKHNMSIYSLLPLLILLLFQGSALAEEEIPIELQGTEITEHLGESISLDLEFVNEKGLTVPLKNFFDGKKPVILALVYYECPNLCTLVLKGMLDTLSQMKWTVGDEFRVVAVSIDPNETPELALNKKISHLAQYGRGQATKDRLVEEGWSFLTGEEENIKTLAGQVGFGYRYDERQKQYAHSAGLFVLTPTGTISRVLYGITYEPRDVKLALLEASEGKIGSVADKLLLFCYHYDPQGKRYALFATNLMKIAAGITVITLGLIVLVLVRKTKKGSQGENV